MKLFLGTAGRTARIALPWAWVLGLASGCANCGTGTTPGGSDAGAGFVNVGNGTVSAPSGPCASLGQRCCFGSAGGQGTCNTGLRCEAEGACCAFPGGASCRSPGDCCTGFGCQDRRCVVPAGGPCANDNECPLDYSCPSGTCVEAPDGMGRMGEPCLPGNHCTAGFACAGGMCRTCGGEGEPCCTGEVPCGTSGSLLCSVGTCERPRGCGREGERCCAPDDACVYRHRCDRGSNTCVVGGGIGDPSANCGDEGERCCRGDRCESGTICEPFLTEMCISLDSLDIDCGEPGELCCLPWLTCEGDAECDFLFCKEGCHTASEECTSADECCHRFDTLCQMTQGVKRCCRPQNSPCINSTDCCGEMTCGDDKRCQCRGMDQSCSSPADCCLLATEDGTLRQAACVNQQCRPAEVLCKGTEQTCSTGRECCSGACQRETGESAPKCCSPANARCRPGESDCCGRMECDANERVCQCLGLGATCSGHDCCSDAQCFLGHCESTVGCTPLGQRCSSIGDCCGEPEVQCENDSASTEACCLRSNRPCSDDTDCCGYMECVPNSDGQRRCKAQDRNEPCYGHVECDALSCLDNGSGGRTCR